jgi:hypothetical protein
MVESAIENEREDFKMARLFANLDSAIEKGELTLNMQSSYAKDFDFLSPGTTTQTVRMYQFSNGLRIAQEKYNEFGTESVRVRGYPHCDYAHESYSHETNLYFLYVGDRPVTDEEEAKTLIHQATGVKLPRLDIPRVDSFIEPFGGYHRVVTDFKDVCKESEYDFSLVREQPRDRDMTRELSKIIERIDSLKEEFVVDTAADGLIGLRETASSMLKQIESKLPADYKRPIFGRILRFK